MATVGSWFRVACGSASGALSVASPEVGLRGSGWPRSEGVRARLEALAAGRGRLRRA